MDTITRKNGETATLAKIWENHLLAAGMAPKTLSNYGGWMRRMVKRWPTLSTGTFEEMVLISSASLRRQAYSATTIHGYQCAMSRFAKDIWGWNDEEAKRLIRAKPCKAVQSVPSSDDIANFLEHLKGDARLIALLCYCCGIRISEAIQLQLKDVNLNSLVLNVRMSKGAKGRKVPIPPELVENIKEKAKISISICEGDLERGDTLAPLTDKEYKRRPSQAREPGEWPLFFQPSLVHDERNKHKIRVFLHASIIEKEFAAARKKSGVLTRITPHRLRDAFAVHSLLGGVPINIIQDRLGHATLETTAKYLAWMLEPEAMDKIPGMNLFKAMTDGVEKTA